MKTKIKAILEVIVEVVFKSIYAPTVGIAGYIVWDGLTFGHISCAILGGCIFAWIGFSKAIPKSSFFSGVNKIDTLRTSTTFGEYRHPLLKGVYYNKGEFMHELEWLAQNPYYGIDKNTTMEEVQQRQALAKAYKEEENARSASNLYFYPVIVSLFGIALGIILNESVFNIQNLIINIIITIIGVLMLLGFILMAESYRANAV